jgi:hypothetical protein
MQEQLSMSRVCSLWSAKLSANTGVLNTNILHAVLYIWVCACVCVCVCVCMRALASSWKLRDL